jgi:hypothetical protein
MFMIASLLLVGTVSLIAADSNVTNTTDQVNNSTDWNTRCAAINNRVEGLISHYNTNEQRVERFSRLTDLLQNLTARIESRGYNVSTLQADQVILDTKIAKFQEDYSVFIDKLENTRNFTCGHSEGQFQSALNESKAQLKIVKADAEDIQQFFKTTIKQDVQTIQNQIRTDTQANRIARIQNRTGYPMNRTINRPPMQNRTGYLRMNRSINQPEGNVSQ